MIRISPRPCQKLFTSKGSELMDLLAFWEASTVPQGPADSALDFEMGLLPRVKSCRSRLKDVNLDFQVLRIREGWAEADY